jgi:hypothetical protein
LVSWSKQKQKWEAYIRINGKRRFDSIEDAKAKRKEKIEKYGEFANE